MVHLLRAGVVKGYQKNQFVVLQGDPADRSFIIIEGWTKMYIMNDEGGNSSVQLLTKGDVFGIDTIFDNGPYLYSAQAVNHCRLLEIDSRVLREQLSTCPQLALNLIGILSHRIKEMQLESACYLLGDSSRRVACLLLRLSSWMRGRGGTLKLPYEKSIAAAQLGMDQATLSRALSRLDALGVRSHKGEIIIDDFSRLSAHCCARCCIIEGKCPGRRLKGETE